MGTIPNKQFPDKLHIVFIGAHPDDADIQSAGTAIKYVALGHKVTFVSLTNGNAGHQTMPANELAERRYKETQAVAKFLGIDYVVLDINDGYLTGTVENRDKVIALIRDLKPNLIITHRPNDYHHDHRNTSLLVQDAAYLIAVPKIVPNTLYLDYNPVIVYHQDNFKYPTSFRPDVFVDITNEFDKKIRALALHESQMFEWLPWVEHYETPVDPEERIEFLKNHRDNPRNVNQYKPELQKLVSESEFAPMQYIEAYQACEYGGELTHDNVNILFPFGISNL